MRTVPSNVPIRQLPFSMAAALVCSSIVSTPASAQSGFGDLAIVHAQEHLAKGDAEAAFTLVHGVLQNNSTRTDSVWADARYLAASAALQIGSPQLALQYTQDLTNRLPEVADYILAIEGRAYRALRQFDKARQTWERLVAAYSASPLAEEAYYGIADSYFAQERYDEAARAYDKALRTYGRSLHSPAARYNIGRIAEMRGDVLGAAKAYTNLELSYDAGAMAEPALARLTALIEQKKIPAPSLSQLFSRIDRCTSAMRFGDAQEAIEKARPLATSSSNKEALLYREAQLAMRMRKINDAIAMFQTLVDTNRGWRRYRYERWLARAFASGDRFDKAVELYLSLAERYRDAPEGRTTLYLAAWSAYDGANYAKAIELFDEFLARFPSDGRAAEAMWYKAWNAYHLGNLALATESLRRIREKYPQSDLVKRAHYWEGRVMAQMGFHQEAVAAYQTAMSEVGYYGVLARQQLESLSADVRPRTWGGSAMVTSLALLGDGPDQEEDVRVAPNMLGAGRTTRIPAGKDVLDWQSAEGKRATTLIRLGHRKDAAMIVRSLPSLRNFSKTDVVYSRARLLHALGDYEGAYRRITTTFQKELAEPISKHNLRYFQLSYPEAYWDEIESASSKHNLPPWLLLGVMRQESAFDSSARSWADAWGLMQIIPPTGSRIAQAVGIDNYVQSMLQDPSVSIRFGSWYLSQLVEKFHGNLALAIGSYNAGPHAMERWVDARGANHVVDEFVEDISYRETRHYVKKVLANMAVYAALYHGETLDLPQNIPDSYRDNVDF